MSLSMGLWFILNWLSEPFSVGIREVFPDLPVAPCQVIALIAFYTAATYPQAGFPRKIGALVTINIIFEGQFFVGDSVVKIPAFG